MIKIEVINILLPSFFTLLRHPTHFLALGLGSGLSPKAPGTAGTLAAIPLFLLLAQLPLWWYCLAVLFAFIVGIYLCQVTADDFGVHDHGAIVWDEFVGLWISLVPLIYIDVSWLGILLGFLLFRLFDIAKPWPISWLDRQVHGGLGIMLDDVAAGIVAALCLWPLLLLFGY